MKKSAYESPMTEEERSFAEKNHNLIRKYLHIRKLPYDEWYDVVVFRYLISVKRWFALPGLHVYKFETIAFNAMRSAIGNELRKQEARIKTVSLDGTAPGMDGMTLMDTVTCSNLHYTNYGGGEDVNIKYNVPLPERKCFRGGRQSDEVLAIEAFLRMKEKKNMCFEYEAEDEAKKRLSCIQAYRRKKGQKDAYDAYRAEKSVYIIRTDAREKEKGRQ